MIIIIATFIELFLCARHRAATFYKYYLTEFSQPGCRVASLLSPLWADPVGLGDVGPLRVTSVRAWVALLC